MSESKETTDWISDQDTTPLEALFVKHKFTEDDRDTFFDCISEHDGYEEGENVQRTRTMNNFLKEMGDGKLRVLAVKDLEECLAWKFITEG